MDDFTPVTAPFQSDVAESHRLHYLFDIAFSLIAGRRVITVIMRYVCFHKSQMLKPIFDNRKQMFHRNFKLAAELPLAP